MGSQHTPTPIGAFQFSDRPQTLKLPKAFLLGKGGKNTAPSLEKFRVRLDGALSHLIWLKILLLAGWLNQTAFKNPLEPELFQDFRILSPSRRVEQQDRSRQSSGTDLSRNGEEFPFPKHCAIKFLLFKP